jgi:Flp pilus assembly protein TadG
MTNLNRIARKLGSAEGAEIAEAALVLPLVFMFLLGIVWFGRAFNIYSTITQAAQQGAITAARSSCATCGVAGWNGTGFASDTKVQNVVVAVMQSSNLVASQIPTNSHPPTPLSCVTPQAPVVCSVTGDNITICREVLLNQPALTSNQPPQCGTIVSFQYPFTFFLPFTSLNMQTVTLSAQAQSRMEN